MNWRKAAVVGRARSGWRALRPQWGPDAYEGREGRRRGSESLWQGGAEPIGHRRAELAPRSPTLGRNPVVLSRCLGAAREGAASALALQVSVGGCPSCREMWATCPMVARMVPTIRSKPQRRWADAWHLRNANLRARILASDRPDFESQSTLMSLSFLICEMQIIITPMPWRWSGIKWNTAWKTPNTVPSTKMTGKSLYLYPVCSEGLRHNHAYIFTLGTIPFGEASKAHILYLSYLWHLYRVGWFFPLEIKVRIPWHSFP